MTGRNQNSDIIKSFEEDCKENDMFGQENGDNSPNLTRIGNDAASGDYFSDDGTLKKHKYRSESHHTVHGDRRALKARCFSYNSQENDILTMSMSAQYDNSASHQWLFQNGYYGKFDTRFQNHSNHSASLKMSDYVSLDTDVVKKKSKVKICSNCQTQETPSWRRSMDRKSLLCNACGLYQRLHNRPRPFFKNFDGKTRAIKPTSYVYICHCCNKVSKMSWKRTLDGKQICNYCSFFNKDILYGNDSKQQIPFRASRSNFAFTRNKSSNSHKTSYFNYNFQLQSVSDNFYQNTFHEPYDQDAALGQIPQVDVDNTDGIYEGLKDYRSMDMYRLSEEYNTPNKSDTDDYEYFEDQMTPRSFKKSF